MLTAGESARMAGLSGRDWSRPCGRVVVLDVEAAVDHHARALAGGQRGAPRGSPLNEIVSASVLTFDEETAGEFKNFGIRSYHHGFHSERDILVNLQGVLEEALTDGLLVTFNGRGFDLPMLWMRQIRWWLCARDAIPRLDAEPHRHVDVMLELSLGGAGRWPSLSDACASLGFSLHGPVAVGPGTVPSQTQKCERDVAATAMLFFHVLAAGRRSTAALEQGLPAFGSFLRQAAARSPHLERFALSRMFRGGPRPWGD